MKFKEAFARALFWSVFFGVWAVIFAYVSQADLRSDFKLYEDPRGFVTGTRSPAHPSGNSLLFTAEKVMVLTPGQPLVDDQRTFDTLLRLCEQEPGLYRRTPYPEPFSTDQESQDDYIGVLAASYRLRSHHAGAILHYGESHYYNGPIFDFPYYYPTGTASDDVNAWLGRFPAFHAHVRWAAGIQPTLPEVISWSVAVATAGLFHESDQDPWILSWLMIETMDGRSWIGMAATQVWIWRLEAAWPNGLGEVFGRYFNDVEHPLAKALWRVVKPSWWSK